MPRTLNPAAHALRRDAFIDVAERLIQTKGYEQMSVEGILDELGASKGAFYHYFDSKEALLGAVVDRMVEAAGARLLTIADDPELPAPRKLETLFGGLARFKTERRDLVLALLRVWLSDDNAIVREKVRKGGATTMRPLLAKIVCQGAAEGVFTASDPESTALVIVWLLQGASEIAGDLFVQVHSGAITFAQVEAAFSGYGEAMERVLGAAPGSLKIMDDEMMREWFGTEGSGKERA
jgi:AcrR family transcriptional regulator